MDHHTEPFCLVCSQSTDSEPVYDQPNLYQSRYSDSEHDRASSASPPASDDIYSEVQPDDNTTDEHLVRPSFVRTRRDLYKGKHCSRLILYLYLRKYAGITLSSCLPFHLCICQGVCMSWFCVENVFQVTECCQPNTALWVILIMSGLLASRRESQ